MVKIRLSRHGKKKKPSYRIVVIDSRIRRDGKPLEEVGFYDPIQNEVHLNGENINKIIKANALHFIVKIFLLNAKQYNDV